MLSALLPRKRWFGLTHEGLSHLWHTNTLDGISVLRNRDIDARCAAIFPFAPWLILPYPFLYLGPVQIQHESFVLSSGYCVCFWSLADKSFISSIDALLCFQPREFRPRLGKMGAEAVALAFHFLKQAELTAIAALATPAAFRA
jgi:hypothetical protein